MNTQIQMTSGHLFPREPLEVALQQNVEETKTEKTPALDSSGKRTQAWKAARSG